MIRDFIGRHFTWLSGTLLGFAIAAILILILVYVPGATANAAISLALSVGAGVVTLVSFIGGVLTIHDYLKKRRPTPSDSTEGGDTDDGGLASPAEGFVKSEEDILAEQSERLHDWFVIFDDGDGEIQLTPQNDLKGDPRFMLYIIAARYAYEQGKRDSPIVDRDELSEVASGAIGIFLRKAQDYVTGDGSESVMGADEVELEVRTLSEAIDWVHSGKQDPRM